MASSCETLRVVLSRRSAASPGSPSQPRGTMPYVVLLGPGTVDIASGQQKAAVFLVFSSSCRLLRGVKPGLAQAESTGVLQAEAQEDASLLAEQDPFAAIQAESSSPAAPVPIQTDLVLPPAETTVAPCVGDLGSAADDYEPASSAAGLEVVGGLGDWFSEKKDNWGASKTFVGFGAAQKIHSSELLILCARRAVLETLAIVESLKGTKKKGGLLKEAWSREGGREGMMRVLGLAVEVDSEGQALVKGDIKGVVQGLAQQGTDAAPEEQMEISSEEAREIIKSWDGSWKRISLADVRVKFAITKRIFQLTGHAISDAKLLHVNTVGSLLSFLVKPPPPRTVMQAIEQRGELAQLPNVQVFAKRQTPVHEAQKVGRWKVIQKELEERGLPVLGSDHVDKYREREWLRGPMPDAKDRKKRR